MAELEPMLARPGVLPTRDAGWAYEFKWDGVRAIVAVDEHGLRAHSRSGKDLARAFPELHDLVAGLRGHAVVLDGELVALDGAGRPSFGRLQQRLTTATVSRADPLTRRVPATFLAFDLLALDGHDLRPLPYDDRRALLAKLALAGDTFAAPPAILDRTGSEALAISRELGMEGIVAKRRDAPYAPGQRSATWIKVKNFRTQEAIIGGWTEGRKGLAGSLGALLLGLPEHGGLRYIGKVGTGLSDAARSELLAALTPLESATSPFNGRIAPHVAAGAHFVGGETVCEVRFGEWTGDGHLRHPSWRGLRPDKRAKDVVDESKGVGR